MDHRRQRGNFATVFVRPIKWHRTRNSRITRQLCETKDRAVYVGRHKQTYTPAFLRNYRRRKSTLAHNACHIWRSLRGSWSFDDDYEPARPARNNDKVESTNENERCAACSDAGRRVCYGNRRIVDTLQREWRVEGLVWLIKSQVNVEYRVCWDHARITHIAGLLLEWHMYVETC